MQKLYHNRPLVLTCVTLFWGLILAESLPPVGLVHEKVFTKANVIVDGLGLGQEGWTLFAPNIDTWNMRFGAIVTWDDGTQTDWKSPEWRDESRWTRLRKFRTIAYYRQVTHPLSPHTHPAFADYLARTLSAEQGKQVRQIKLKVWGEEIPHPKTQWRQAYQPPEYDTEKTFYTWYPHELPQYQNRYLGN